jgi:hypothetical protein
MLDFRHPLGAAMCPVVSGGQWKAEQAMKENRQTGRDRNMEMGNLRSWVFSSL